eukprot:COSAG05_NODE_14868_length_384_cov_1.452632_1_plen_81_part_00
MGTSTLRVVEGRVWPKLRQVRRRLHLARLVFGQSEWVGQIHSVCRLVVADDGRQIRFDLVFVRSEYVAQVGSNSLCRTEQ